MKSKRAGGGRPFLKYLICLIGYFVVLAASAAGPMQDISEADVISEAPLQRYAGKIIEEIEIQGNTRTGTLAIRWLLGGEVGQPFSPTSWVFGVRKLFNTTALYDIETHFQETSAGRLSIQLSVKEKWTLLPFFSAQGSNGAFGASGGLYDVNLGGYFTQVSLGFLYYNTFWGFDLLAFQEYLANTDWMLLLDLQLNPIAFDVSDIQGKPLHAFAYYRKQLELGIGRRVGQWVRINGLVDIFQDQIIDDAGAYTSEAYTALQYRFKPQLIVGRSNLTNYLEEGFEFRLLPVFANFANSTLGYAQGVVQLKQTFIVNPRMNFAYFVNAGLMTSGAPVAYQFRLGGFDTVRGFDTNRFVGNLYTSANLEFRPTLVTFRWSFLGLDLIAIQGCLFVDGGWIQGQTPFTTTPGNLGTSLALVSAGAGLRFNFVKIAGAIVRFDLARTISPNDGFGFAFGVGQLF